MARRLGLPFLALALLLLACFARLAAEPSALIVDADRPSLDHARPGDDASPGNDATRLFLPHHLGIADRFARDGKFPTWDDRGFGGRPMVGNPQAGLFYPPAWIVWASRSPAGLGWITAAHMFWSGLGAFWLARTLRMGVWGATVASGCVQASPYVLAQAFEGHYPHVWAASWYPWAFAAALRLRGGDARFALVLPPILAATFLSGHPQEGYYLLIALGCWAAFDGVRAGKVGLWGWWVGVLVVTAGLVAVEVVPDAMAQGWGLKWGRMTIRMAGRYHINFANLLQVFGPRALGGPSDYFGVDNYWESVTSIGLVPAILAATGVAMSAERRAVRGWFLLVLAAVVFASGRKLGLFAAMYAIVPGMDRFRVPARSMFLASLGASMLAGYGVEALRAGDWGRWPRRLLVFLAVLAVGVMGGAAMASGAHFLRMSESQRWLSGLARLSGEPTFWLALAGSAAMIGWGWWRPSDRRHVAAALGILGLVELGWYGHLLIVTSPADRFLGADPITEALRRAAPERSAGPPRIRAVDSLYDDLRAGRAGLSKANLNDSFQLQHSADLYETLYRLFRPDRSDRGRAMDDAVVQHRRAVRQAVLDRMGIALIVSDAIGPDDPHPLVASGTWDGSTWAVRRNPTAMPGAYVVPGVEVEPDETRVVGRFTEIDPREKVFMTSDPLGIGPRQPYTPADWASTDPDRVVIRVETEAPGLLVVAETWMPGWSATVDGRGEAVLLGNHAQKVVPIRAAGRHEVVLRYEPPGLALGLGITASSALIWLGLAANRRTLGRLSLTRRLPTG